MIKSESKVPVKMKSESAGIDNNQYDNISSVQYSQTESFGSSETGGHNVHNVRKRALIQYVTNDNN